MGLTRLFKPLLLSPYTENPFNLGSGSYTNGLYIKGRIFQHNTNTTTTTTIKSGNKNKEKHLAKFTRLLDIKQIWFRIMAPKT